MRSCGSLVTFTVCVASLSSEICLAAVWCARARVCVYVPDFYHRVLHRGYQSSTDDIEGICLGHFYVYSSNVSKPGKKQWCVCFLRSSSVCVFSTHFFFLIVKIDSSSIPLINEIAGKNKPICHLPINGNHSSLQRCPSRERQLRFGSGVDQSGGMTTTN